MRPCELTEGGGEMRPKCLEIADEHETVLESKAQRECVYVCVCVFLLLSITRPYSDSAP